MIVGVTQNALQMDNTQIIKSDCLIEVQHSNITQFKMKTSLCLGQMLWCDY